MVAQKKEPAKPRRQAGYRPSGFWSSSRFPQERTGQVALGSQDMEPRRLAEAP